MKNVERSLPHLAALAKLDLFRGCTNEQLAALLPDTDIITVAAGTVIDRSGTFAQQFVGVIDGYVEALHEDCPVVLAAGDHFGAVELFERCAHEATYTAITESSLVVVFGPVFRAVARLLPAVVARSIGSASRPEILELAHVG